MKLMHQIGKHELWRDSKQWIVCRSKVVERIRKGEKITEHQYSNEAFCPSLEYAMRRLCERVADGKASDLRAWVAEYVEANATLRSLLSNMHIEA